MVDIPNSTATTRSLAIGTSLRDSLEVVGDTDWIRVTLTAGETYRFSLDRAGIAGDLDPFLNLRDASGNVIATNDDGGPGYSSQISGFTATTSGVSTGAPYALAIASVLGKRVRRVILAGGIAGPEVLETAGGTALVLSVLGRSSRTGKVLHQLMRLALAARLDRRLVGLAVGTEKAALERLGVAPEVMEARLLQSLRTGSRRNLRGALADARLVARPWDFTVGEIGVEVDVLHGGNDPVVPPTHAHWYAAHLPRARLELVPGELHISLCFRSAAHIQHAIHELSGVPRRPAHAGLASAGAGAY